MNPEALKIIAARASAEGRAAAALREGHALTLEAIRDRWQDEASEAALGGNPTRAHTIEGWARGLGQLAMAVRGGMPYRRQPVKQQGKVEAPTLSEVLGIR